MLSAALAAIAVAVSPAWSQTAPAPIDEKSVVIERLGPSMSVKDLPAPLPGGGGGSEPNINLGEIINIAQKVWKIIEDNKPVVDVKTQYATALPAGLTHWDSLSGWKAPKGTVYGFYAKNAYGMKVIDVEYQVLRTYGGSYNGKGRYLTAVTIEPLKVDVAWGYKFSLNVEIPDSSIVNVGTTADPVAAMMATVKWNIATTVKNSSGKSLYYMQGDGLFNELGGPFKKEYVTRVEKALDTWVK
jgi:hypothetical protein